MTFALVAIDGRTFAIRADRIEKTVAITGASRMSQQRSDIVAAVVDEEVRFFSDLAVLMGGEPAVGSAGAGIVLRRPGSIAGFAVPDAPQEIGFEDHRILPVAESMGHDVFDACAFFADQSIPVFSDAFLSRLADGAGVEENAASRVLVHADSSGPANRFTRIDAAGRSYLIATREPLTPVDPPPTVVRLPGPTGPVAGMAAHGGEMVPVIDLARRLGIDSEANGTTAAACTAGDSTIVLLLDEIAGEVPDAAEPIELSPLLAGPAFREAVVVDGEPLPLIRVEGLLAGVDAAEQWADEDSSTPSELLHADLRVVELALAGSVYAVPAAETADPPNDLRRTSFPVHHPLVSGAYATGDRILPEIDLASYLGHTGKPGTAGEPLLVRSGGVEAVFTATSVEGERVIPRDDQRMLPIRPAHDVVYGCYVDGDDLRLILNPGAIARYGRDPAVQTALVGLAGPAEEATDERASVGGTATVVTGATADGAPEVSAPTSEAPSEVEPQPEAAPEPPAQPKGATAGVED
ncbi:MAG: chemotaxis protein CheW, partial [Spirochaetota bacterium]